MNDGEASQVAWDIEPLIAERGPSVESLLDEADKRSEVLTESRGRLAEMDVARLAAFMTELGEVKDLLDRAGSYASLRYAADTSVPEHGALLQKVEERGTLIETRLLFFELEWAALEDEAVEPLLSDPAMDPFAHHLRSERRYRDHLLSEPEEKIIAEKRLTGRGAWSRLFGDLTSDLEVELDGSKSSFEEGLSRLSSPDASVRAEAATAVTASLQPGLKTRGFLFNTILHDKAIDDRLRGYSHWLQSRNLANEASDESVQALVKAVVDRYDIPQRWYELKAKVLGVPRIKDWDRAASLAESDEHFGWTESKEIVLTSYASFSEELAALAERFFDERWIDAPPRPGKRPGAFCAYTVPSHHPYVMLNFTARRNDVLTLAHELGHGLHAALAREQGIFHQSTPLTLAETASVFGETVTGNRLLAMEESPRSRFALLAGGVERAIATVFRQIAMNRFEDAVHNERRSAGELSTERFAELWVETQTEMLGDAVEITEGYRSWWSYVPHFIATPGYVYAYAYGQLLALAVYKRYEDEGPGFVPSYLELLSAGGSMTPEALGRIVGCDLTDPNFWSGGLEIVDQQLSAADRESVAAGLLS